MTKRRVVVTGFGAVTPLANDALKTWAALIEGRSGISTIDHFSDFDVSKLATHFAGTISNFQLPEKLSPKDSKKMDVFIQYGLQASSEAISHAGLESASVSYTHLTLPTIYSV